jgi:signal transduction histidine kinase
MSIIREIIALNRETIYFVYGLVFFIVGLAIALQSRNYSRLDLARSLKWLSAFGFTHGLHEWGDLFIPIQAAYLSPNTIHFLHYIHLLLLALSFTFLFEFGVTLLRPLGRARWLHGVSGALLAIWFVVVYFPLSSLIPDFTTWHNVANALARYFIGFPGGLVAAYGLRQHTIHRIAPLNVPHIVNMLQISGLLLALYALTAGLIPPAIPFFPGNFLNSDIVQQVTGAPPPVFRSLIGLGLAIAIIRALEVFDVETARMIEGMEQQQAVAAERDRIARELHDGAIQKVYTAGLLVDSARKLVSDNQSQLSARLEKAVTVLNDAIGDLRHNLGELQAEPVDMPFSEAVRNLVDDPRFNSLVDLSLDFDLPEADALSPLYTGHILAILNEALSNVIRHARARRVKISVRCVEGKMSMTIEDDGIGLPDEYEAGYGLRNMRDRARLLGGQIDFKSINGRGTRVTLIVPWEEER